VPIVNPSDASHSAADAHAPSTETACGRAALGDALGQVTTRTSRKRRAVSSKRGGGSPEMCERGRLGGEPDRKENSSLPAQEQPIPVLKEDQQLVQEEIEKVFIDRVIIGHERDSYLSKESFNDGTYRRDKLGLYWTDKEQRVTPNYDNLREEFIHSIHTHPYAGHYGVNRTLKKAQEVYFWPGIRSHMTCMWKALSKSETLASMCNM
jgi:hypothetical protein